MAEDNAKSPLINAHMHVFTSEHVPPYLAKKFIPFPFYYLINLHFIVKVYKRYFKIYNYITFESKVYKKTKRNVLKLKNKMQRNPILGILKSLVSTWLVLLALYFIYDWIVAITNTVVLESNTFVYGLEKLRTFLKSIYLYPNGLPRILQLILAVFVLLFIKSGRNLISFVLKKIFSFFSLLPSKKTKALLERYLLIVKYAKYKSQKGIFGRMKFQYPPKSEFVLLSMDMEYMKAGKTPESFEKQLEGLLEIKNSNEVKKHQFKVHPFVFIDPRRIAQQSQSNPFFDYQIKDGKVVLKDSTVKTYIESHEFSGFKIYPALGYYPFDKNLLALWKYAEQHQLPIMSHCIKGTVFYRGKKEASWDYHPVFRDENTTEKLLLPELKNMDFQINFTHPMNFLCLLEEPLLRQLIEQYNDENLKALFGYTNSKTPLTNPFKTLKFCLAHYGGEEHWERYLEKDAYHFSNQIIKQPGSGIQFITEDKVNYNRLAKLWKHTDWYSIISSMMIAYDNVYADISYILHNPSIFPLLKETLSTTNEKLRSRVLYGSDFYVVRNHNSDKELYIMSKSGLSEEEFDIIARDNPRKYLSNQKI